MKGTILPNTQQNEMTRYSTETRHLFLHGLTLSILCVISYSLITHMLTHLFPVSRDDDLLGGMWAVSLLYLYIATATSKVWALPYRVCGQLR